MSRTSKKSFQRRTDSWHWPFLSLYVDWNVDVLAGAPASILDHEAPLDGGLEMVGQKEGKIDAVRLP